MEHTILRTERLLLRPFTERDLPAIFRIYHDETMNRFLPWFALQSLQDARAFFETRLAPGASQERTYAICLQEDDLPIGHVSISEDDAHELGYALLPAFWRRGIATEAAGALVAQCKAAGYPFVTATHDVKNPKSGAVMRRLGMRYQYSYQEQWQPKDIPVTFRLYQRNLDEAPHGAYRAHWERSAVHFVEPL